MTAIAITTSGYRSLVGHRALQIAILCPIRRATRKLRCSSTPPRESGCPFRHAASRRRNRAHAVSTFAIVAPYKIYRVRANYLPRMAPDAIRPCITLGNVIRCKIEHKISPLRHIFMALDGSRWTDEEKKREMKNVSGVKHNPPSGISSPSLLLGLVGRNDEYFSSAFQKESGLPSRIDLHPCYVRELAREHARGKVGRTPRRGNKPCKHPRERRRWHITVDVTGRNV